MLRRSFSYLEKTKGLRIGGRHNKKKKREVKIKFFLFFFTKSTVQARDNSLPTLPSERVTLQGFQNTPRRKYQRRVISTRSLIIFFIQILIAMPKEGFHIKPIKGKDFISSCQGETLLMLTRHVQQSCFSFSSSLISSSRS